MMEYNVDRYADCTAYNTDMQVQGLSSAPVTRRDGLVPPWLFVYYDKVPLGYIYFIVATHEKLDFIGLFSFAPVKINGQTRWL